MDWFDGLLEDTKNCTQGPWWIEVTSEGYNNISGFDSTGKRIDICGDQGILLDGGLMDNENVAMINQISDLCFWNNAHMPNASYDILDPALRMWCEDQIAGDYYPMLYIMEAALNVELE